MSTINQDVVSHLDESNKTLKAAEALVDEVLAEGEKIAATVPGVVQLLIQQGQLPAEQTKQATAKLASHEGCLQVVQNLVQKMAADKRENLQKQAAAGNGTSVSPEAVGLGSAKSATVDRSAGGFVGRRPGQGQKTAADIAFEQTLMGEN